MQTNWWIIIKNEVFMLDCWAQESYNLKKQAALYSGGATAHTSVCTSCQNDDHLSKCLVVIPTDTGYQTLCQGSFVWKNVCDCVKRLLVHDNSMLVSSVVCRVVISPGLPASAAVPHSTKRGKPVGVCMRAVIKVGPNSVRWKLPQLLLLLWQKTIEAILVIRKSLWDFDNDQRHICWYYQVQLISKGYSSSMYLYLNLKNYILLITMKHSCSWKSSSRLKHYSVQTNCSADNKCTQRMSVCDSYCV